MIIEHVAVTVSNLDKSIEFYTRVLGLKLIRRTTTSAYLHLDDDLVELMQSVSPRQIERPQTPQDWDIKMHGPLGLSHIGFRVENMDEAIKKIQDLGGEVIIPPHKFEPKIEYTTNPTEDKLKRIAEPPPGRTYWINASISDPDGTIIELVER